ncbi:hypothetical protein LOK49_LG03G02569 [Camellia lanceoleosa]|uniref:Uncharacterized protein n=1 Tax=Camellia lanceoleosa TaxID=1840588 RepID=A0ACC0IFZ7_9ERIC|nr:hypothetical protein LOK49_LG03G02569 [Camellia lanceoleosa]
MPPQSSVNQSGKRRGARNRRVPARLGSTDYIRILSLVQDVQTTPSPTGPSSLLVHEGTTPPRLKGPSSLLVHEGTTSLRLEGMLHPLKQRNRKNDIPFIPEDIIFHILVCVPAEFLHYCSYPERFLFVGNHVTQKYKNLPFPIAKGHLLFSCHIGYISCTEEYKVVCHCEISGEARSFDVFISDFIWKHTNGLVSWKHLEGKDKRGVSST